MKRNFSHPFLRAMLTWAASIVLIALTIMVTGVPHPSTAAMLSRNSDNNNTHPVKSQPSTPSLDYTADITLTTVFTTYLPAVLNGYPCGTIPTLSSPSNGSSLTSLIPLFRWDGGYNPNATAIHVDVGLDSDLTQIFTWVEFYAPVQGPGTYRFSYNFTPATTYYWRAFLKCGENTQGPYSETWSFTTGSGGTILTAPNLIAPADGGTVPTTTVTLRWSPVDGAVQYLVTWNKTGTNLVGSRWVNDTQVTASGFSANSTYRWWVKARNDYAFGNAAQFWQFTIPPMSSSTSVQDSGHIFVMRDHNTNIEFEGQRKQ